MELDLNDVLKLPMPANDGPDDVQRVIAIVTGMQEGIDRLTQIVASHQARIEHLEQENSRLKARTDAPARTSIIRPH